MTIKPLSSPFGKGIACRPEPDASRPPRTADKTCLGSEAQAARRNLNRILGKTREVDLRRLHSLYTIGLVSILQVESSHCLKTETGCKRTATAAMNKWMRILRRAPVIWKPRFTATRVLVQGILALRLLLEKAVLRPHRNEGTELTTTIRKGGVNRSPEHFLDEEII